MSKLGTGWRRGGCGAAQWGGRGAGTRAPELVLPTTCHWPHVITRSHTYQIFPYVSAPACQSSIFSALSESLKKKLKTNSACAKYFEYKVINKAVMWLVRWQKEDKFTKYVKSPIIKDFLKGWDTEFTKILPISNLLQVLITGFVRSTGGKRLARSPRPHSKSLLPQVGRYMTFWGLQMLGAIALPLTNARVRLGKT